jgi:hypothetical protein
VRAQELLARDGVSLADTTLRRYAHEELGWKERGPTVLIDDPPPGEEAQIDFGERKGFVKGLQRNQNPASPLASVRGAGYRQC